MKLLRLWMVSTALLVALNGASCGGGGANVQDNTATLGQQLIDLDAAYKKGIITEKEYEKAKNKLLEMKNE
jgi:hypothetical protein